MGNGTSSQRVTHDAFVKREDGEVSPATNYQRPHALPLRLRGGNASARPTEYEGVRRYHEMQRPTTTSQRASHRPHRQERYNLRSRGPIASFQRASPLPYRQDSYVTVAQTQSRGAFDFDNYKQPLPWHERDNINNFQVRQFAYCNDTQLLAYLAQRSISPTFLHEIDSFFEDHPELASYEKGRRFLSDMRMLSPLSAYITFIIGYTMPARYIYDINTKLPLLLQLPPGFSHTPLSKKYEYDPDLMDIFEDWGPSWGHAARLRILDQIDETVSMGIRKLALGRPVNYDLRKLICYAIWGNPVDAYKWFRYSYQLDNLKDHYLPEHIILVQAPKPRGYAEPQPSVPVSYACMEHRRVRRRMARARDQGIDVLDVLVKDYRMALVRSGHRHVEVEKRCATAKAKLAQAPTGVDIVDLIMDDAVSRRGTNRQGARKARNRTRTKRR